MAKNILSNILLKVLANAIRHETKTNIIFQKKEEKILILVDDRTAYFAGKKRKPLICKNSVKWLSLGKKGKTSVKGLIINTHNLVFLFRQ